MLRDINEEEEFALKYMSLSFMPILSRKGYLRDIECSYKADPIIYIFQAISNGIASIFLGIVAAYLYEWFNKKKKHDELLKILEQTYNKKVNPALKNIDEKIDELRTTISSKQKYQSDYFLNRFGEYEKTIKKLKEKDEVLTEITKIAIEHSNMSKREVKHFIEEYRKNR